MVNTLQCNVTSWSEHAKHYILTSDFDAALISETHLEREKLVTAVKAAMKLPWAGTGSAAISTANNGASAGVLALVRTRWGFLSLCLCVQMKLDSSAPTHDWQGGSYVSWVGRFCCLQLISSTPSVSAAISTQIWCKTILSRETESFHSFWERISISRQACGKTCPCMEAASLWIRKLGAPVVLPEGTTRVLQATVKNLTSSIISWCQHTLDL